MVDLNIACQGVKKSGKMFASFVFSDAFKKTLPNKASENSSLLSSLYSLLGDTRLALAKGHKTITDLDGIWKDCPEEELGLLELTEKELDECGMESISFLFVSPTVKYLCKSHSFC